MGIFHKAKKISIAEQDWKIKTSFPNFSTQRINFQKRAWIGQLQPTRWSICYKIRIVYDGKNSPKVTVLEPRLLLARGKTQLPHVYSGNELCLFHPKKAEWSSSDFIADTILPWTSLWLSYYENWLYTGIWQGGGEHPNTKKEHRKNDRKTRIKI